MILEVDNTTEQLLVELQNRLRETISSVKDGQDDIKKVIDDMQDAVSTTAKSSQVSSVMEGDKKIQQKVTELMEKVLELNIFVNNLSKSAIDDNTYKRLCDDIEKYNLVCCGLDSRMDTDRAYIISQQHELSEEIKGILSSIQDSVKTENKNTLDKISHNEGSIEELKNEMKLYVQKKDLEDSIEDIVNRFNEVVLQIENKYFNEIKTNLEIIQRNISRYDGLLDELKNDANAKYDVIYKMVESINEIEGNNKNVLGRIAEYLSMPGYKRFFRGMDKK